MTLRVLRLYTYWNAGEATTALELIDTLREQIIEHYGDAITDMLRDAVRENTEYQLELPFTDLPPF